MTSTSTDRRYGVVGNTAIKTPVDCATTANITLSGEQTIDGVATAASRVLVRAQTNPVDNGIYDSDSGNWSRAVDFNGTYDVKRGTLALVTGGGQRGMLYEVTTANPITVDVSSISWGAAQVGSYIETFGAAGDGVTDDTAAFVAAAASGRDVLLRNGETYLLNGQFKPVSGTYFICNGVAKILIKTGLTFNSSNLTTSKVGTSKCLIYYDVKENVGLEGIEFVHDGGPYVVHPIQVVGGMDTYPFKASRITFRNFPICNGGLLAINSVGEAAYNVEHIHAYDCGTASTAWTGTPQITVFEIDNDMVASTPSYPGTFLDIQGHDVAFTGAALAAYGQQTDVVNIAGVSGTDRKGPTGFGVFGKNVGEVIDLFCTGAVIKGVRAESVQTAVKIIHGGQGNCIDCDYVKGFTHFAVAIAGSDALTVHTMNNVVKIGTIIQDGIGISENVAAIHFLRGLGSIITSLPRNNYVEAGHIVGDSTMKFVVRDNCNVDDANGNMVRIGLASGYDTRAVDILHSANVAVHFASNTRTKLEMSGDQTLTTGVTASINFDTVVEDAQSEYQASNTIRVKLPGLKFVKASVRIGCDAGDHIAILLYKGAALIAGSEFHHVSGLDEETYTVGTLDYCLETEAGLTTGEADYEAKAVVTSAGTIAIKATTKYSWFEVRGV